MTGMDLEGIGALSAAGVALIGIPATVLIGRWQMKAALRTAEATSEAGLAQAESSYRAALDAVRAETYATHMQWRRGIQREAYASFLLAAHRVVEVGERIVADNAEELPRESIRAGKIAIDDALATLKAAQTIIELEGPDDVAAPAAGMTNAAQLMALYLGYQATFERAQGKLHRMLDDQPQPVSTPAERLIQALSHLGRLRSAAPSDSADLDEHETQETRAAERSCREAGNALPPNALDYEEFEALLEGHSRRPPMLSSRYLDAARQFDAEEVIFVRAAKMELHSRVS
ncbi:hypothetical protein GCM10011579_060260 [Streptomyces albiflavescens]|uniref:Uncharacterized protein n=1 Tax=Streptomyces albiflavescens TaxID=1623582 RepID=A0A918D745_9ACTN|nr:hypothetical protein [Streptomyces albiflavescens]GGN77732.1 hypothetical protein GCM10011579_060260 [Streptomyces albiflavescens]